MQLIEGNLRFSNTFALFGSYFVAARVDRQPLRGPSFTVDLHGWAVSAEMQGPGIGFKRINCDRRIRIASNDTQTDSGSRCWIRCRHEGNGNGGVQVERLAITGFTRAQVQCT